VSNIRDSDTSEYPSFGQHPTTAAPIAGVVLELGAATHAGLVRSDNEDHYLVARLSRSLQTLQTNLPIEELPDQGEAHGHILVVADGLGGHAAGELASRLAIHTGLELILSASNWTLRPDPHETVRLMGRLREYFIEIDRSFQRTMATRPDLDGMATTLTVAYTVGLNAFLVHVGDSRVYRYSSGMLEKLTHDHTVAQSLADSGMITADELRRHVKRHVLTNVISGRPGEVRPDVSAHVLQYGDILMLCSDGLHDLVEDSEIAAILGSHKPQPACDALIAAALSRGGRDNVTVVVARFSEPHVEKPASTVDLLPPATGP